MCKRDDMMLVLKIILLSILLHNNVFASTIFEIVKESDAFPTCDQLETTRAKTNIECGLTCSRRGKNPIFNPKNRVCHCSTNSCKHEEGNILLIKQKVVHQPYSCKNIKEKNPSATSGSYSIYLPNPTLAFCDMETDGGGWIQIGRVQMTTNADVSNYYINNILSTNLLDLNKAASQNFLLSGATYSTLQYFAKFHEFRIFCTKPYHGRTNHASFSDETTPESKDIFDHVMGLPYKAMNTCHALKYMPDDNSLTQSGDCTKNIVFESVNLRLYQYTWHRLHQTHFSVYEKSRLECDDMMTQSGFNNLGTWLFYVR